MRTESKTKKIVDLDSALLSLKHSRLSQLAQSGVRSLPKNIPSTDFLTKIGMNVLERAQSVRDSLMKTVKPKSAKKPQTAVTAKAATAKPKAGKKAAPKKTALTKTSAKAAASKTKSAKASVAKAKKPATRKAKQK